MSAALGLGAAQEVPQRTRTQLVHAYLQLLAKSENVDLLHVKGAAVHPELGGRARLSVDADVIVRPAHVERFVQALRERAWQPITGFEAGSAFGHAMNLHHDLGQVDLHRFWPGFAIAPSEAFDVMWAEREGCCIAGIPCDVPSLAHQRLILLLHHARSGGARADDRAAAWDDAPPEVRDRVLQDARRFRAELALAASTGHLARHRNEPGYLLWRYFSEGDGTRTDEWIGRLSAASGIGARLRVLRALVTVNQDLLRHELGRQPAPADMARAAAVRFAHAAADLGRWAARRSGGGHP